MNFRIRSKTDLVRSLLNMQKGVQEFTEIVEKGEEIRGWDMPDKDRENLESALERNKKTLRVFKLTFNEYLEMLKPYEVKDGVE